MIDEKDVSPETRYVLDDFEKAGVQVHPNCPKYPGNLITCRLNPMSIRVNKK